MRNGLVSTLCLVAAAFLSLPAFADIKAFNAAVSKGDYKAAAAEAESTWPTLDKSRKDITVIAQEFGYAAFMSNDYAASRTYAEFTSRHPDIGTDPYLQAVSTVLLKLSDHRLKPSGKTRDELWTAVTKRAEQEGFDNVSFFGVDSVLAWDMDRGNWMAARTTAELGVKLATVGGSYYAIPKRRLELYAGIAGYFAGNEEENFVKVRDLQHATYMDIDAAASDDAGKALLPIYWETRTWRQAMGLHMVAHRKKIPADPDETPPGAEQPAYERFERLFPSRDRDGTCKVEVVWKKQPEYPSSSKYQGFVGAVLVATDIDDGGNPLNVRILGAVPEKAFGPHVLELMKAAKFKPAKDSMAGCKLARQNHRIDFDFSIRPF
jgi:TonB family protein